MDSSEVTHDFPPFFRVYQDGHIEQYVATSYIPPTVDPQTGVESKDVTISQEIDLKPRIFISKINSSDPKIPLVVHYHGGAFYIRSPIDADNYSFLTSLTSKARVIDVFVASKAL
ncbi:hypothetical protein Acr_07g0015420 [Actinidia rufa]|uniref:Alpha/beta-Hydrolases superfamily protein n=1 Tax=Actinidia rufa TaxID=165716 RepID=A0A7J0EYT0_9ERIC|nr:hypothetical protein Acr_07g0015420 [Actinidia rufa]